MSVKRRAVINPAEIENLEERMVDLRRVTKVVKGGRTFSFAVLVVVGNRNGIVGLGYGKAKEIPEAIRKGVEEAKRRLCKIHLHRGSIAFEVQAKYCASKVRLFPAAPGAGVIAGENIRAVLEYAGVQDIFSKTYGSRNTVNSTKAALKALVSLPQPQTFCREREMQLDEFYN